jgi:dipeptidyl aminopeptidase/acylaminoacyl peptidase
VVPPDGLYEPEDVPSDPPDVPRDAGVRAEDAGASDASADTADSAPAAWKPATPGESVPDCRAPGWQPAAPRDAHVLAVRAQTTSEADYGAYLVQLSPQGISTPTLLGPLSPDSGLGTFSTDGRYFAFTRVSDKQVTSGIQVVALDARGVTLAPVLPGRLFGFAPTSHQLLLADVSLFKLYDVAQVDALPRKVPAPYGRIDAWAFSPDGRSFVFSASEAAQPGLRRLDLSSSTLQLEEPFMATGGYLRWSPTAGALAFTRQIDGVTELWLAEWPSGSARVRRLVAGIKDVSVWQWLDAERLVWMDAARRLRMITLHDDEISDVALFTLSEQGSYSIAPGGACIAYVGDCGANSDQGVCVLDTRAPANRIQVSLTFGYPIWQDSGGQLAIKSNVQIEVVNLDGAAFSPALVADQRSSASFSLLDFSWAPNGAPWLTYRAPSRDAGDFRYVTYLWNVKTHQTVSIDPEPLRPSSSTWSADGRYLILPSHANQGSPNGPVLVQRVDDAELGPRWTVEGLRVQAGITSSLVAVQP